MNTYLVTPDSPRVPKIRVAASDLVDLGHQVALHLTRHKHLLRGIPYDAQIGNDVGFIRQDGLPKPLTFTITQEQA